MIGFLTHLFTVLFNFHPCKLRNGLKEGVGRVVWAS